MLASKDRIALVTGANKGIGFEIGRQLGKEGNRILIGARDRDRGQTAVANLRSEGFAARYVQIDLTGLATIAGATLASSRRDWMRRSGTTLRTASSGLQTNSTGTSRSC